MDIVERLRHAATTACNDDLSDPNSEKRARHVERYEAMQEGTAEIDRLRSMLLWIDTTDPETVAAAETKFGKIKQ
jgi:hypothetical protein